MHEEHEVVSIYTQLLEAWNRRDASAFADLFTDDGSSVGFDGSQMNGRTEIGTTLRQIFADHQTAVYLARVREVRPLGSEVTLLRAVVGMVPPGKSEINPDTNAVQSVVVTTAAGQPRIALLHNTPAAFHGRPELGRQLTDELAALVRTGKVVDAPGPVA